MVPLVLTIRSLTEPEASSSRPVTADVDLVDLAEDGAHGGVHVAVEALGRAVDLAFEVLRGAADQGLEGAGRGFDTAQHVAHARFDGVDDIALRRFDVLTTAAAVPPTTSWKVLFAWSMEPVAELMLVSIWPKKRSLAPSMRRSSSSEAPPISSWNMRVVSSRRVVAVAMARVTCSCSIEPEVPTPFSTPAVTCSTSVEQHGGFLEPAARVSTGCPSGR